MIVVAVASLFVGGVTYADDDEVVVRWDIVSVNPPFCPGPGGVASAQTHHNNNSTITFTGSGTFKPGDREEVTGGGTWTTATSTGTYKVIELVSWHQVPASTVNCSNDPTPGQRSAGLAVLRIKYNDGSKGVLAVSCRLPGSPPSVFEGIAVSKDFIGYTHNVEPVGGVNANRTLFHVQKKGDNDNSNGD
jgi:hypothetical protein